nr:hypothetical protein [uncultured Cellulosilyticum sp.]
MSSFYKFLEAYDYWMVNTFGYDLAVKIEDIFYGLSMIFIGILIMALLTGIFIRRLYSLKDFGESKVKILRVDNGRKSTQTIQIRTLAEAFHQVILLSFSPLFTFKRFTERDEKRTKRFVKWMLIIAVFIILFGLFTTFTVLRPIS